MNMKDLTHYFSEASKDSENTSVKSSEEVRNVRAKSEMKKRERVKIKITNVNSGSVECKLIENKKDLIDKTPSPLCNVRKAPSCHSDESPRKKSKLSNNVVCNFEQTEELIADKKDFAANGYQYYSDEMNDEDKLFNLRKNKIKETMLALANKRDLVNRNIEESEIEECKQEKKRFFSQESKKEYSNNGCIVNGQKQSSCSLLNYFSKLTPEQPQKEKTLLSKIIVKAEIHHLEEECAVTPSICTTPQTKPEQKKTISKSESVLLSMDEIEVLSSECITSSPSSSSSVNNKNESLELCKSPFSNNVTPKSNKTPKNRPRWSMKIKLNLADEENTDDLLHELQDCTFDEDIFTPRSKRRIKYMDITNDKKNSDEKDVKNEKIRHKSGKSRKSNSESPPFKNKILPPENNKNSVIVKHKNSSSRKSKNSPSKKNKSSPSAKSIKSTPEKSPNSLTEKNKIYSQKIKDDKTSVPNEEEQLMFEKISPKSTRVQKLAPIFTRRNSAKENEEVSIIEEPLKRKQAEKLAPLFVKRRKTDPEILAARRLFLQPELVDLTEKEIQVKPPNLPTPLLIFPKISHVTQVEKSSSNSELEVNFTLKPSIKYEPVLNLNDWKFINSHELAIDNNDVSTKEVAIIEPEIVVKEIEARCENTMMIWEKVSKLAKHEECNNGEIKPKKKKGRPKKKLLNENSKQEEEDPLKGMAWTSKYKPTCSKEVIGNEDAVKKLKNWLDNWKSKAEAKEHYESDDDFYNSDSSSFTAKNLVAVLMGPHGCGKTSSVYAVAEELGYRVIEVNASSKRPGKKILKDLEEATKSHRIHNNHGIESFGFGTVKMSTDEKSIPKNSLILFDDIDLVFEEDDGFMNAAFQLASNTKRPIAMTCRNTFSQISKFAPQQVRINFDAVPSEKASTFLELITLAETRQRLPVSCAEALTMTGDLRKALLQLQYLLLSDAVLSTRLIEYPRRSMWKEMHNGLYRPMIKATKTKKKISQNQNKKGKGISNSIKNNSSLLHEMAENLENLSLMSSLSIHRDVALESKEQLLEDSLSLTENMSTYCKSNLLGSEIHEWIAQKTIMLNDSNEPKDVTNLDSLLMKKNIIEGVNMALTQTAAPTLDRRAISLDYLPYVRAICRTEEIRQNSNAKRGNRFYHYLQGIVTARPHSFTAACKMLQEKSKERT